MHMVTLTLSVPNMSAIFTLHKIMFAPVTTIPSKLTQVCWTAISALLRSTHKDKLYPFPLRRSDRLADVRLCCCEDLTEKHLGIYCSVDSSSLLSSLMQKELAADWIWGVVYCKKKSNIKENEYEE